MYLLAAVNLQVTPDDLYTGLWGYNAVLTAIAIGGVFYTPNLFSISIGLGCAFVASLASWGLAALFAPLKLPVLALPFVIVTISCFLILRRSLPSLVPVALHTVASPEEHRQRFLVAKRIISNFRRILQLPFKASRVNCCLNKRLLALKETCAISSMPSTKTKADICVLKN